VVSGFKELNGKKILSEYEVIRDTVSPSNGPLKVWEIHANSRIEDDPRSFGVQYYYSSERGFVSFSYTIDEKPFAALKLVNH